MQIEFQVLGRPGATGRQILGLEFEGGHDALALLGVKIEILLAGGFGGVHHAGERQVGVAVIALALLEQAADKLGHDAFIAPDGRAAAGGSMGLGPSDLR